VAKGGITAWSCNPAVNGFQTTNDYVIGLGGEQVTEMGVTAAAGSGAATLAWQHTNVWAGGKLLGTYDRQAAAAAGTVASNLHFYLDDPLGTRRAQTDYAGVIEQTCSSLPYGDALNCTGGNLSAPTEHHFTGKERDSESGNDYFMARYYSSAMGRFMSPDWSAQEEPVPYAKLDDPQSLNLYAYVRNNPLSRVDADGHIAGVDDAAEGGAVVVTALVLGAVALEAGAQEYNNSPEGQRSLSAAWSTAQENFSSNATALKNTVTGWFSKKDAPAKGPVKGADSPTVTSNGQAATPSGEVRGGSGAPRGHSTTHSTKKGAKEAAAQSSKDGKVRNDANPKDGRGGHFHPNETDNKGSEHHYYPKKNNP
jgi:RHS repeat-associated protein